MSMCVLRGQSLGREQLATLISNSPHLRQAHPFQGHADSPRTTGSSQPRRSANVNHVGCRLEWGQCDGRPWEKPNYQLTRSTHLDCISACAFDSWCGTGWWGWHGTWGVAGTCCWGGPAWHWEGAPAAWDPAGGSSEGRCGFWGGGCCCCCCLYRERLKKRPRMALRFPFLISARQSGEILLRGGSPSGEPSLAPF